MCGVPCGLVADGRDFLMSELRQRVSVNASSRARRGDDGASACRWKGKPPVTLPDDRTSSTSKPAQIDDKLDELKANVSG